MNNSVLFVDDDPNILASFRRHLRNTFRLETASSPREGLQILQSWSPFAVVVADLRMPEMNGVDFLRLVSEYYPDTVRIMLTGNADLETAIHAVNEGNIYRFLTKPCEIGMLRKAVQDGLQQHHLITAERELLEKTLSGSVRILTDVLSMLNPEAFSRGSRVRKLVHSMLSRLELANAWQIELAAMLSQIGCVTLPPELLRKIYAGENLTPEEQDLYNKHPEVGEQLLANIPRLESIGKMIAGQNHKNNPSLDFSSLDPILAGTEILRASLDFDRLLNSGLSYRDARSRMRTNQDGYDPIILDALLATTTQHMEAPYRTEALPVKKIKTGMVVGEDIRTQSGLMLIKQGQEITLPLLVRLRSFAQNMGVEEPIQVWIWHTREEKKTED